jgi:hypothetical protein
MTTVVAEHILKLVLQASTCTPKLRVSSGGRQVSELGGRELTPAGQIAQQQRDL